MTVRPRQNMQNNVNILACGRPAFETSPNTVTATLGKDLPPMPKARTRNPDVVVERFQFMEVPSPPNCTGGTRAGSYVTANSTDDDDSVSSLEVDDTEVDEYDDDLLDEAVRAFTNRWASEQILPEQTSQGPPRRRSFEVIRHLERPAASRANPSNGGRLVRRGSFDQVPMLPLRRREDDVRVLTLPMDDEKSCDTIPTIPRRHCSNDSLSSDIQDWDSDVEDDDDDDDDDEEEEENHQTNRDDERSCDFVPRPPLRQQSNLQLLDNEDCASDVEIDDDEDFDDGIVRSLQQVVIR